jgi:glutaredoxin
MKPITIYSTPVCHYCNLAKEFFKANGIMYVEHNVAQDLDKRKEMIELTGQLGVPVIRVGDEVTVGFSEPHMRQLLGMDSEMRMAA